MTGQMTCTSEKVRRTKFFFGARYIWTRQQLSEPHAMVGAGIANKEINNQCRNQSRCLRAS